MQYSYKSFLVYLITVVTVTASCDKSSKKEKVKSVSYGYSKPKETPNKEKHSNPEEEKNNHPEASPIQEVKQTKEDVALEELRQRFDKSWNEYTKNFPVTNDHVIDDLCNTLIIEDAQHSHLKRFIDQNPVEPNIVTHLNEIKDRLYALLRELSREALCEVTDGMENKYKPDNNRNPIWMLLHLMVQCACLYRTWPLPTEERFRNLVLDKLKNYDLKVSALINEIPNMGNTFNESLINYYNRTKDLIISWSDYDLYNINQQFKKLETNIQADKEKNKIKEERKEKIFDGTESYPMDELKKSVNERINEAVTERSSGLNTQQQLSPEKEVVLRIKQACNPIVLMESKNTHITQFIAYCKQYIEHIKGWYNKLTDEEQGRLFDLYTKQPNQPPYIIACVKQLVNDALKNKNSTLISNTELRDLLQIEKVYADDIAKCALGCGYLKKPEDLLLVFNLKQDGFTTTDKAIKIFTPKLTQSITTHEETHKRYQKKLNSAIAKLDINIKQATKTP